MSLPSSSGSTSPPRLAVALRSALASGYGRADLRADILAGVVVGIVALPLSMALGIASGLPPEHGLYTAVVAGLVTALLGGSAVQVTGPTAAFVVLLAPVSAQYGMGGLLIASLMAGLLLLLMGVARLGVLVEFVPYPVTVGFTAGIAIVIATLQLKDFLGLTLASSPEQYLERVHALALALPTLRLADTAVGVVTLALLIVWPRLNHRIPAPLVALGVAAGLAYLLGLVWPEQAVATINSRFSYVMDGVRHAGIPRLPPMPSLAWLGRGPDGQPLTLSLELIRALAPAAAAIAMLGAIESLLSAVVADGMSGKKHDPDAELLALGISNVVTPFFGGFAATGAIARTATNVRSGARSPLASASHACFVLLAMVSLAPVLGYLPMAGLAALLLRVAWNMGEARHVVHTVRTAPRGDVVVLLTCMALTVIFDMVVSVTAGVLMAAILFMRRMVEVSGITLVGQHHPQLRQPLPAGVVLYDVAGPLFFGAAQKAMGALSTVGADVHAVILDMTDVPVIDATGLVNLRSAVTRLSSRRIFVVLTALQTQPAAAVAKAELLHDGAAVAVAANLEAALRLIPARASRSAT